MKRLSGYNSGCAREKYACGVGSDGTLHTFFINEKEDKKNSNMKV